MELLDFLPPNCKKIINLTWKFSNNYFLLLYNPTFGLIKPFIGDFLFIRLIVQKFMCSEWKEKFLYFLANQQLKKIFASWFEH